MQNNLTEIAIKSALNGDWKEAVELNLTILREESNNIAALNRLGRAYLELNRFQEAETTYKKVLKLDAYNSIAKKNLNRIKIINSQSNKSNLKTSSYVPPICSNFLEEIGKTKTSQLVRLADSQVLSNIQIGEKLKFNTKKRNISVNTEDNTYIGTLPDDLSYKILRFTKLGYKYEVFIKSLETSNVQIFIREIYRSKRLKNYPSFPSTQPTNYRADISHRLMQEEPVDVRETGNND